MLRDITPVIGTIGAFATISLGEWNDVLGIGIGLMTIVYLAIRIGVAWREFRNK